MQATLELDAMQTALETIAKTAAPFSGNITLVSDGSKLKLFSISDLSWCVVTVPCEVEGAAEFGCSLQGLRDAIKGRDTFKLVYSNSVLNIKGKGYATELNTVDPVPFDRGELDKGTEWRVTVSQSTWLKETVKLIALKPTSLLSSWIPVGVHIGGERAFACCYDTQHMSWVTTDSVVQEKVTSWVMPLDMLNPILDVFGRSNFQVVQGKGSIRIRNKVAEVNLALPNLEDFPTIEQVMEKAGVVEKTKGNSFVFQKVEISKFLSNARAVVSKERAELVFNSSENSVTVSCTTSQGSSKAKFAGTGTGEFKVDLESFNEALAKVGDQVHLNVVDDSFLSMKSDTVSMVVALNQK